MKRSNEISPIWITVFKILLPLITAGIGALFTLLVIVRSNQIILQKDVTDIKKILEKHDNSIVDIKVQDGRYDELFDQILNKH